MVGADGEVGRRRPRLDLLVRAMGEDPVRETLDVSGEDWESILSGGMELAGTLLAASGEDGGGDGSGGGVVG